MEMDTVIFCNRTNLGNRVEEKRGFIWVVYNQTLFRTGQRLAIRLITILEERSPEMEI